MKYRFAVIAVLGMLIMTGCGHDMTAENIDDFESVANVMENDDSSCIPEDAAYKRTTYLVEDGESKSLFKISSRTSFRQILPIAALKKLTIRQYAFAFSPCPRQNYARKSAHAEILNRL